MEELLSPSLEVRLLGAMELVYRDKETDPWRALPLPPTLKSQSLLAYLVLHSQPPPTRERLAALFWPERPPSRARRSLSTALWHIRRCFPVECLRATSQRVQFAFPGTVEVDVHTFERLSEAGASYEALQQAADLYRGDFLEGFYDDWALNLRYHLQSRYLDVLARLMRAHEARRADRAALQTALRLLTEDPFSEAACQTALRAYAHLGQREAALQLYRHFAATLRKELDTAPAPETTALYRQLLRGPAMEATPAPAPSSQVPSSPPPAAAPAPAWLTIAGEPPLVGRAEALQRLHRAWGEAALGRFRAVWVCGEAGIGKTRLVETFAREARARGGLVLWGRCTTWENEPYAPLADLLRAAFSVLGPALSEGLSRWQTAALVRLLPELTPALPPEARPAESLASGEPRLLLRALAQALAMVARRRLTAIVLEDLHWASPDLLTWLPLLAKAAASVPLLLVGTCRREEIPENSPLPALRLQWQSTDLAEEIALAPLSLADLRAWLPPAPPDLLRALHHHTGGNPFFVLETLRALVDGGQLKVNSSPWAWHPEEGLPIPETVRQAVCLRREQLPLAARQALETAAVLGRALDLETWRLAWGRTEDDLLAALDVLLRRGWIVEGQGPFAPDYAFNHHVTREVIYRSLTAARRRALHRRVAQALMQLSAHGERAAAIAFHYFQAEAWEEAWPHLLRAGDRAANLAATAEALTCYTQAQQARQRAADAHREPLYDAALARKIGDVYFRRGEYEHAERHLRLALAHLGRPLPRGKGPTRVAFLLALGKRLLLRLPLLRRGDISPQKRAAIAEEVAAYTTLGWIYTLQGKGEPYLVVALRALNAAGAAALPWGEAMASTALGFAADFIPWFGLAERLHRRSLGLLPQLTRPDEVAFVHFGAAYHALLVAEETRALEHAAQAAEAYRRAGTPQRWAMAMLNQAYVWLYRGDLPRAETLAEALLRTGEEMDAPTALSSAYAVQGYLARLRGQWEQAAEYFRSAARLGAQIPDYMTQVENLAETARCQMRLGNRAEALGLLERAAQIARAHNVGGDSLVRVHVATADVAVEQARHALANGQAPPWRALGRTLRHARRATRAFRPARPEMCLLLGRFAYLRGDIPAAQRWWQRGMRLAQAYGHTLDWALLALEAGTCLRDEALAREGRARLAAHGVAFANPCV